MYVATELPIVANSDASFDIIPQHPYAHYAYGSVYIKPSDGRKYVTLKGSNKLQFWTPYARYLMAIKIGRLLTPDEEVDHIDNNPSNDDIDNLQILSHTQNCLKRGAAMGVKSTLIICPVCKQLFVREINLTRFNVKFRFDTSTCSNRCNGKLKMSKISKLTSKWIHDHQIIYVIRTHYFDYEDWYGDLYPHSEIVATFSREMYRLDCTCADVPGLTEYCWDILTPLETQIVIIKDYFGKGYESQEIMTELKISSQYLTEFKKNYIPEALYAQRTEYRTNYILEGLKQGKSKTELANELDVGQSVITQYIKEHFPFYLRENQRLKQIQIIKDYFSRGITDRKLIAGTIGISRDNLKTFISRNKEEIFG